MKKYMYWFMLIVPLLSTGCFYKTPSPVKVEVVSEKVDFLADVKPIFDKRCVPCHSCYNSACQLKLSSFEGADRGATKELVYDGERLFAQDPTRLFMDATTTEGWRDKHFYSVTENSAKNGFNNSTMAYLLQQKMDTPLSIGKYRPESDELSCAKDKEEVAEYLHKHPNRGMPYGFPALNKEEYKVVLNWLQQGAKGPSKAQQIALERASSQAQVYIDKWEKFLNQKDPKHVVTARYLYEHLFIAHLHFPVEGDKEEFYELVRSKTAAPNKIKPIATVRPFDNPNTKEFYYRIRKIHSTIVHKTHIIFEMDDVQYADVEKLFIQTPWMEEPHVMDYDEVISANPFLTYAQIPPASRYQFLLNNAEYIIRTFIRGPVCKGQIALNVIHDHFWLMFVDPAKDYNVINPQFLLDEASDLSMPIERGNSMNVWDVFSDQYRDRFSDYIRKLYSIKGEPIGLDSIWRGNRASDAPMLTVYRHFDSASVRKGVIGQLPRTAWVVDYPQLERIYYALVAGFDVFGNVSHQANIRRYMDYLRIEGELNFVSFLPDTLRYETIKSWYIGDEAFKDLNDINLQSPSKMKYSGSDAMRVFIEKIVDEHLLKSVNIDFDHNYVRKNEVVSDSLPTQYNTSDDYLRAFRTLGRPKSAFKKLIDGSNSNVALIRIKHKGRPDSVYTIIINRWHDNVNSLFSEEERLDPTKDTADFIEGSMGSYPNFFLVVEDDEVSDFFELLENYEDTPEYMQKVMHYGVPRSDPDFWEHYDWFQEHFNAAQPIQSGLYDLNRYYYRAW